MSETEYHIITRPLHEDDLATVVDIDTRITGHPRSGFFEKRVAAALARPNDFIYIGCELNGRLCGHLLARLQKGEYGVSETLAVLDAIGVDPEYRGRGIGNIMMQEFEGILRHKKVREFQTQTEWYNLDLLKFFSDCGFKLAPRQVLERDVSYMDTRVNTDPVKVDARESGEVDYSDPGGDDSSSLARDLFNIRSLCPEDKSSIIRIDKKVSGLDHTEFYEQKVMEVLDESGIRVSLVAEKKGQVVGFIMARVDYGEFGRTEPVAVLDSIAVDPDYGHHQVGSAMLSQLLGNLATLRLETVRTEVDTDHFDVLNFLKKNGFHNSQRLSFSYRVR